ncbi:MAG: DUF4019 domain-containing protein [Mesorhizobium sp.]|uniref:DUF4019 domain-containing protein n=1 Tax=Mesorhizobium sp. TaxID=1871066 RepID=UPI0011FE6DFF|nr:DUF4019 domain-containing protein [Mesorhizobium sp.]TIT03349.1 MAG: DUF4019 domain-containing protein [Mesorhizobium sp.]TIT52561.1 MAG: DUF4019 domain-containing protein [Mesorhizobium sp.]
MAVNKGEWRVVTALHSDQAPTKKVPMTHAAVAFLAIVTSVLVTILPAQSQEWMPSEDAVRDVTETVGRYFLSLDNQEYGRAYEMMTDAAKASIPSNAFMEQSKHFHSQAGAVRERRLLKFTWLKDPANAPFPGVYAAVDIATKFENIDRHCGYIVLYQRPSGGNFQVMRAESNFIDNANAKNIEKTRSELELDRAWAELSTNCPNFPS